MTGGALESPLIGPASVAIEDQPDMTRYAVGIDIAEVEGHSITASEVNFLSR